MTATRQAVNIQLSSVLVRSASSTYQIAIWSSAVATTAAASVPSQILPSWRARAMP
nr:hypothetical protein [Streptomyces himalayensis]